MSKNKLIIIKLLFSGGLLFYLFQLINLDRLVCLFVKLNPWILSVAVLVYVFQMATKTVRWKILLTKDCTHASFWSLFRIYLIGNFILD